MSEKAKPTMSDEAIRDRTGRGWQEWFAMFDRQGAQGWGHTEIARWLGERPRSAAAMKSFWRERLATLAAHLTASANQS